MKCGIHVRLTTVNRHYEDNERFGSDYGQGDCTFQKACLHQRDPIVHATSVWCVAFTCFKGKGNRIRTSFLLFDSRTLAIIKSGWPAVRDSWGTGEVMDSSAIGAGESILQG